MTDGNYQVTMSYPPFPHTSAPTLLGRDLWFDTGRYAVYRNGKYIPLTAQEAALLAKLLETPWSYVRTTLLARHLSRPDKLMTGTHCIEQTIHTLRRKLGDNQRQPKLILNLRRIGYGIFPEIAPHKTQTEHNLSLH